MPVNTKEMTRVASLFQQLQQRQCSPAEKAELLEYLKKDDPTFNAMLESYMAESKEEPLLAEATAGDILEAIFQAAPDATVVPVASKRKPRTWYYLAAAVAIPALAAMVWLFLQPARKNAPVLAAGTAIQPGSDKAVLVLENGQQVALNGTETGTVSGSNGLLSLAKGVLQYQEESPAGTTVTGYHTLSTPRGGKFQLWLPDGTRVWLNAASSVRYPARFTGKERVVELKGEAYFEVAAKADMPFYVKADSIQVNVLGTGFNIMAYHEEGGITTTLEQGSIMVKQGQRSVLLQPGQQAVQQTGNLRVRQADLEEVLAWKEDKFRFKDADIRTIMRQVARWYDIEVNYTGQVYEKGFSGTMQRKTSINELLDVLQETRLVHFTIDNNRITVWNGPA